jgi:DNA-binding NtrC family response regulator
LSRSILIVDDEQDLVNLFSEALEMQGYNVCSFTNPILVYDIIKQNPNKYSLLIADYRMPSMDGLSLASKLLELNKEMMI